MKKNLTIILLLGSLTGSLLAQGSIVAAGGDASGAGGSVSYTSGLTGFMSRSGSGGVITEGVQQPYEIYVVSVSEVQGVELSAVVFPNPTSGLLKLRIEGKYDNLDYTLLDLTGKIIEKHKLTGPSEEINMSALSNGLYFLKVSHKNRALKTFQIVKVN